MCYSWWVLASLKIIGRIHWIDKAKLSTFILACQDEETGGFADRPGDMVFPFCIQCNSNTIQKHRHIFLHLTCHFFIFFFLHLLYLMVYFFFFTFCCVWITLTYEQWHALLAHMFTAQVHRWCSQFMIHSPLPHYSRWTLSTPCLVWQDCPSWGMTR